MKEAEYRRSVKKALRMQKLMKFVFAHGLGGFHLARVGREAFVDTRRGKVRVLEYGFEDERVLPLYVDLHGGGFIFMQADADEAMNLAFLQAAEVKIVSIDYPKAPGSPYPAAVEAVHDVVAHYLSHAGQYRLDTAHMGIGGHSAGANLATVTCLRDLGVDEFRFRYQILDYPPLDLAADPYQKPRPKGCISPKDASMYNACYISPEQARQSSASPVLAGAGALGGMPKALMLVCGGDSLHDEGVRYARLLREAGTDVTLQEFPAQPHGFTYFKPSPDVTQAIRLMGDFIVENSR